MLYGVFDQGHKRKGGEKNTVFLRLWLMIEVDLPPPHGFQCDVIQADFNFMGKRDQCAGLGVDHGTEEPGHATGEFAGKRRYRVGDWRVIYTVDNEQSAVIVLTIAHRSEVYE